MKNEVPVIYEKHRKTQQENILERAENYFIIHGIEKANMSSLALFCGITRSTLYRYYPNKEKLLWGIHHKKMKEIGTALTRSFQNTECSTIQRFQIYMDFFITTFEQNPDYFIFFDRFGKIYQTETANHLSSTYSKYFLPGDFGSKDTVRFLCKNFHDGSVNSSLDPTTAAVTVTYSILYTIIGFSKDHTELQLKYGVNCNSMVRTICALILDGLK